MFSLTIDSNHFFKLEQEIHNLFILDAQKDS